MLVLSRRTNEAIRVGNNIRVIIVRTGPETVRVGIEAPDHIEILREELLQQQPAKQVQRQ